MPTRDRIAHSSVPSTLEAIGDGWTLSLLSALLSGPRRFEELAAGLGIPRSTLSTRLRHLVSHGLVEARAYRERPTRHAYALSAAGASLLPVLALADAFDVTHAGADPSLWHGDAAGHAVRAVAVCATCGEVVHARDVTASYPDDLADESATDADGAPTRGRATRARSTRKPLWRAREVLEDAWAAKVVAALFMGEQRFTGLVEATQAAPNIVSERLQRLTDAQLVRGGPAYQLSPRGLALYPLVVALIAYGDARRGHPSLALTHRCGAALRLRLRCASCGEGVLSSSVSFAMQVPPCTTPTRT
ncbi:MAG: helix-turn-helix transcriptional regulator [Sandaracinaceae bacterium]|nr:helix-turn-helix transcriptional regulator [Sandaracinaceae bacterium]